MEHKFQLHHYVKEEIILEYNIRSLFTKWQEDGDDICYNQILFK